MAVILGSPVQSALLAQLGIKSDPGANTPTRTSDAIAAITAPGFLDQLGRQEYQPPAPPSTTSTVPSFGGGGAYSGGGGSGVLLDAARKAGFPNPALAVAVAMAESGGNNANIGDNGQSVSAWQIHMPSHPQYDRNRLLADPYYAAQAAYEISGGGANWNPWTMYRNGGYRQYL